MTHPKYNSHTIILDAKHDIALRELAKAQDMSMTAVVKQALRVYQTVYLRALEGQTMAFVDKDGNVIRQILLTMPIGEA
jgi:hypothetical protein